jgi:hypothetical protein
MTPATPPASGAPPQDFGLIRDLAVDLAEGHRPRYDADPFAAVEQYLVRCPSCSGATVHVWRPGEPVLRCPQWQRALDLGLVRPVAFDATQGLEQPV